MSSSRKRPYFYNNVTKESSWEAPPGMSEDDITRLPGIEFLSTPAEEDTVQPGKVKASHLLVKHAGSRRPSSWKEVGLRHSATVAVMVHSFSFSLQSPALRRKRFLSFADVKANCTKRDHCYLTLSKSSLMITRIVRLTKRVGT